jgi:integrase
MAVYKQPKSKNWWYKFTWNGEAIRESTKQTNKRVAEQMEATHKTALAKGEVGIRDKKPAPTFSALCEQFLNWTGIQKSERTSTVRFYGDMVRSLLNYEPFRNLRIDKIDRNAVDSFVEWRRGCKRKVVLRRSDGTTECRDTQKPLSIACINRELATLRRILNLAHEEWGLLVSIPPKIRLLPGEKNRERVLSQPEEDLYLALAPDPLHDFAVVCLDTGMRPGEIQRIRWENTHFEPADKALYGYIHNPEGGPKKRRRNLPMTVRVREVLLARHANAGSPQEGWAFPGSTSEGFVSYWNLNSQHDRTLKRLGAVAPFCLYDLRHTALTRYGESGSDIFSIRTIAGHTDLKTTGRYVHPTPEHIERAVTQLEGYNSKKVAESMKAAKLQ